MQTAIKKSFICKNIKSYNLDQSRNLSHLPKVGDVALFRVNKIGKHTRIQNYRGKNRLLFPGDLVLLTFGNRYATNQIEGYVPDSPQPEYHILGQGGVAGIVRTMYAPLLEKGPTSLELVAYATDEKGRVLNTKTPQRELAQVARKNKNSAKVILSVGTAMDSGKTTTAGYLCRGIAKSGKKVAYMKLTGTVYTKDMNFALDCGAHVVIDFSYYGFPSTFMCGEKELVNLFHALLHALEKDAPEYVVVEIADGLLQRETAMLLQNPGFMDRVDNVIFSAGDSLSVLSGMDLLEAWGAKPFAVSGVFTSRPLLVQEVNAASPVPVLTLEDMDCAGVMDYLKEKQFMNLEKYANLAA